MDATTRFWHGVLGAELIATIGTPTFRHYFFNFGPEQSVAFFEYRDTPLDTFAKPAGVADPGPSSSTTCRSTCPTSTRSRRCGSG